MGGLFVALHKLEANGRTSQPPAVGPRSKCDLQSQNPPRGRVFPSHITLTGSDLNAMWLLIVSSPRLLRLDPVPVGACKNETENIGQTTTKQSALSSFQHHDHQCPIDCHTFCALHCVDGNHATTQLPPHNCHHESNQRQLL